MMPRKFRVLQIGGDDLEPIFQHKKGVSWITSILDCLNLIVVM